VKTDACVDALWVKRYGRLARVFRDAPKKMFLTERTVMTLNRMTFSYWLF